MPQFASAGSQKWLQIAVNRRPQLLSAALHRSGALPLRTTVTWYSPLESENFREYRDGAALERAGINTGALKKSLREFWPDGGPVWDGIGITSEGQPIFLEAKAHIPEAASGGSKASDESLKLIEQSLAQARHFYAPRATATWSKLFYQYANRLAYQYFLRNENEIPSTLVFLYFVNADDMLGPMSEAEWNGAVRLIHAALGLRMDLTQHGIFDAFLDVKHLQGAINPS